VQADDPVSTAQLDPAQSWHTLAPRVAEYLPAWHGKQLLEPSTGLCVPWLHAEHADPTPEYPTSHVQAAKDTLPSGHVECDGQDLQTDALKAPTAPEYFPFAQLRQVAALDAPTVPEYVPARHTEHAVLPAAKENLPAAHWAHALAPPPAFPSELKLPASHKGGSTHHRSSESKYTQSFHRVLQKASQKPLLHRVCRSWPAHETLLHRVY
jgi:hypothetical protein